jgi:hypothetical protein
MMIQHAGLNPMANKAKAGTPVRNLQSTLDALTSAGIAVCVYEELPEVDADRGPQAKVRIKRRALTQIVSAASSTYMYDLCLRWVQTYSSAYAREYVRFCVMKPPRAGRM